MTRRRTRRYHLNEPTATPATRGAQAQRIMALAFSALILAIPTRDIVAIIGGAPMASPLGGDFAVYGNAAARWLSGGGFYEPWQLTAHYAIWAGGSPILYPPVLLLLLVPFTVLPGFLWWAIPAAMISWAIWRLRPAPWSWPLIAACLAWPPTLTMAAHGNPVIWAVAFLAIGCVTAGPAVLVLLKPSLAPFALVGANRRRWWTALGLFTLVSLPFGQEWLDWLQAILNSDGSLTYSLQDYPILALPLAVFAGRRPRSQMADRVGEPPGQQKRPHLWRLPAMGSPKGAHRS
jgi:hypothetical protein